MEATFNLRKTFLRFWFDKTYVDTIESTAELRYFLKAIWFQKVLGFNRKCPWPISPKSTVSDYSTIHFHPDDVRNFASSGCYFQNFAAPITIGKGTYIAPNVGIITANHSRSDLSTHDEGRAVTLMENCWIGMNSVILPGVTLGPRTVVGAGSVVTRSFKEGNAIIAGNPARKLRDLNT